MKFIKTLLTFIGLKLLEVWCLISCFTICIYIILAVREWDLSQGFLHVIGNIAEYGVYTFFALFFGGGIIVVVCMWFKDNWKWAKEIVNGDEPRMP